MRGMHNRKAFKKVLPLFLASSMVLSNISVFATENTNGEINLALNKTTFSSGDETEGFNSTKVTDGIINRNANNGEQSRWASVRYAENPYVGVDLGEKTVFNEVVIEWERKNINSYEIQISDDKDSWTTIYTGTTVNNYRDVISLGNQEARYVRAVVKEYDPAEEGSTISWETVSVYELEVYNRDSVVRPEAGVNIALNKTATASSQEGGTSFSAAKAFDGTIDRTSTKQSRWASAVSSEDQWLKVDLGEVTEFDNIVIEWERRNAPKYRIQVSDDDVTWNDVYTATAAPANFKDIISLNERVRGRYVRLYIDEHLANSEGVNWNTVSVYELELYNGEIPEAPKTAAEVAASLKVTAPTEDATVLKMPSVPEGFEISFIGADYEEVIDYDMNIHKPLVDTKVVVNFEVKKGDEKATSPAFEIIVPGQYEVEGNVKPTVIPELREWAGKTGNFEISNNSRIVINPTSAEELRETAETFAKDYKDIVGNDIEVVVSDAPQAGDFYLSLTSNYPELREEGYYMDIDDVLSVEGNDASAIFLSTRSILQILKQNGTFIEKGLVRDYPQYDVRGFMLDVGRKPISLDFLYEVMQNMSWYKLNDFQIHLNDNYIWVGEYPAGEEKQAYSGFRLESNDVGENGVKLTSEDTYYTKEEFGNFIDDAKLYGVNIVPEIDSPGHSLAFTKVHPEYAYGNGQGENAAMLNVNDEKVVDYIKSIFSEYMDGENPVFRNSTVHIGTDEFYGGKEEYRAYTDKMLRFIKEEKGSNVRVWGSLSNKNGSTPVYSDGVEMNIWNSGWANAQAMYDQGYDLINTEDSYLYLVPGANYYYNYLNHSWLYNNWEVNTFSNGVTIPEGSPQMNGGMFALWNDMIDNKANGIVEYDIFDRILPGMQVLSEKMWGEADDKTYNEFVEVADEVGVAPNTNPRFEVESETEKVMEYDFNKFENNTVEDKSENGYDSTEINNASVNDGVLELAGGNSYIKTGINNMGPNYSVSFSVKRDENSDDSEQILFESSKGTFKAVQAGTGKLGFSREGYDYSFDYELPKGEWVDITVVGKLNKTEIYVNGEYVEQILEEGSNIKYTTFVFPLEKIGSESKAFKGQVDNLVITNEAVITDETVIDSTNFTVTSDNENALVNGVEGPAYLAFDNDLNTIWHSNYSPYQALPATIEVDMKEVQNIDKITYIPRQDGSPNGRVLKCEISVKANAEDEYTSVGTFTWDNNIANKYAKFDAVDARYVKISVTEGATNSSNQFASAAEFTIHKVKEEVQAGINMTIAEEVTVGSDFDINVNLSDIKENMYAMEFEVDYDETKVDFKEATSVDADKYFVQAKATDGKVKVVVAGLGTALENVKDIVKLTFTAKASGENIAFDLINGKVADGEGAEEVTKTSTVTTNIKEAVNKSELTSVIEEAKNIIENESDKYTEATINALKEAVKLAEEVVANEGATQDQVDVAKTAVQNAIGALEEKEEKPEVNVDKTALKITIDYANELKDGGALEGVVPAVVKEFNDALAEAEALYANVNATEAEVKASFDRLTSAIHMLSFEAGDKSELENLINSANALDKDKYTEESWAKLEEVLAEANGVLADENAMQEEVNEVSGKLQQTIENLEEKPVNTVDKSILQGLVDRVEGTDSTKYIPSTWTAFANALEAANTVLSNENATQEEVDSAYSTLLRAYLSLRLTPDKSLLEGLIKEVESIDLAMYTAKSAKAVEKALKEANKVLADDEATEKEINTALANLENAKNSLVANSSNSTSSNNNSSNNNNQSSSSNNNSGTANSGSTTGNSNSGKLPQTGTAGVAGTLISGVIALLGGLGLSRKKNKK